MGEYAKHNGQSVKIGTCEDMYYLRLSQRFDVQAESGNVNPVSDAGELRFRFPWPDEDGTEPGCYSSAYKEITIPGATATDDVEHGNVQFSAHNGYLLSLPCPEKGKHVDGGMRISLDGLNIALNGYGGAVKLVAQRLIDGRVVPVFKCGGCGHMWRIEDAAGIEEVRALILAKAESEDRQHDREVEYHKIDLVNPGDWWREVAHRLDWDMVEVLSGA